MQLTVGNGRVEAVGLAVVFEGGRKQRTVGGTALFSKNAVIYDIYGEFAGNFDFFAGHLWVTYGSSMARPSVIYGVPGAVGRAGAPGPGQRGSVIRMSARLERRSRGGRAAAPSPAVGAAARLLCDSGTATPRAGVAHNALRYWCRSDPATQRCRSRSMGRKAGSGAGRKESGEKLLAVAARVPRGPPAPRERGAGAGRARGVQRADPQAGQTRNRRDLDPLRDGAQILDLDGE